MRKSMQSKQNDEKDLRRSIQTYKSTSPFKMKYSIQDNKDKEVNNKIDKTTITNKNETQNSFKSEIDQLDMEISDLKNQLKSKIVK